MDSLFGGDPDTCLIIDETSFIKKGVMSVGVARQWCGRLGKVENCQVGVFAALSCRSHVTLIDTRLYLPEVWINDPDRCIKADIPEEFIIYQKKSEQALDMIKQSRNAQPCWLWHRWIALGDPLPTASASTGWGSMVGTGRNRTFCAV